MRIQRLTWLFFLLIAMPVLAQNTNDCPAMVQTALELVQTTCETTQRNEVCYGNGLLQAVGRNDADFVFEQVGDIVDVTNLESIQASALDLDNEVWGIALLQIQANLPETLPGQNVTMLFVGDVYAENRSEPLISVVLKTRAGVNIRRQPTTSLNNVLRSISAGVDITATGRLADGSWVRVIDDAHSVGWVSGELLEGDISTLPVVEQDAGITYGAMQAFYFQSGITNQSCAETPTDGILLQTPEETAQIEFLINGVRVRLGSTVFVQAYPGDYLYVTVLDGTAILTANGVSQTVPAGAIGRVSLGEDGMVSGTPEFPQGYSLQVSFDLLLDLLPETIEIAEPLTTTNIQQAIDEANQPAIVLPPNLSEQAATDIASGLPPSGRWRQTNTIVANTCGPDTAPVGTTSTNVTTVTFQSDRSSVTWDFGFIDSNGHPWLFNAGRAGDNTYSYSGWGGLTGTITFTSPTTYTATHRGDYAAWETFPACIYYEDYVGQFVGG
jgi:hypothetical protein